MRTTLIFTLIFVLCNSNERVYSQKLEADQIYDKFKDAVVVIISYGFDGKPLAQGSGVIINDSGYVVTNFHNFENAEKIEAIHFGKKYNADNIIGADIVRDLLVIKLKGNKFQSLERADLRKIRVGQKVYTIGTPQGLENTLSECIISRIGYTPQFDRNLIQITAPITHGSSGGAVLNEKGELIGISSYGLGEANINFAIPIDELENIDIISYSNNRALNLINIYYRGINAYHASYYEISINYLKNFISIDSSYTQVYYQIGLSYEGLEEADSAIVYFKHSISKNPQFALAYGEIGYVYLFLGEYLTAEKYLIKAITMDSTLASAYNNLGALYIKLEEYDKAIFNLEKAININPFYESAYMNIAVVYKRLNDTDKAITYVNNALIINPNSELSYYNLGSIYQRKGDYYTARDNYLIAIKIDNNFLSAYVDLAYTYLWLGELDNSIRNFNRVIYLYENDIVPKNKIKPSELIKTFNGLGSAYNKKTILITPFIFLKRG
jgi:tetratricopeptide (TPR) repeat protein